MPHTHALRTCARRRQPHNTSEAHAWQRRQLEASLHGDVEREQDGPSRIARATYQGSGVRLGRYGLLDRLDTSVLARDRRFDERSVSKNQQRTAAHKPENQGEWLSEPQEHEHNHHKDCIQALLRDEMVSHLHGFWRKAVDRRESTHQDKESNQQQGV